MIIPDMLKDEEIDLTELKNICKEYIDFVSNKEEYHEDNDYRYYIYEKALEAIYGKAIWKYKNEITN